VVVEGGGATDAPPLFSVLVGGGRVVVIGGIGDLVCFSCVKAFIFEGKTSGLRTVWPGGSVSGINEINKDIILKSPASSPLNKKLIYLKFLLHISLC
jgi:hypothetical protein